MEDQEPEVATKAPESDAPKESGLAKGAQQGPAMGVRQP